MRCYISEENIYPVMAPSIWLPRPPPSIEIFKSDLRLKTVSKFLLYSETVSTTEVVYLN